ncbi:MAG: signal peptidase I [Armatimonadota bacterium]|nr:MAG: signal peptidase I [Armatimonadota bacterium]
MSPEKGEQQSTTNHLDGLAPEQRERASASKTRGRTIRLAIVVVLILATAVLLRLYVYESDIVEGSSMSPGLRSGDFVLICKLGCDRYRPERFDVITFRAPDAKDVLIKRVIGLPGEWVWVWGDQVLVDGSRLVEPYRATSRGAYDAPVYVPEGSIYVLGDNRDSSEDSRTWGPIPVSSVRGSAVFVYFPFGRARLVR